MKTKYVLKLKCCCLAPETPRQPLVYFTPLSALKSHLICKEELLSEVGASFL